MRADVRPPRPGDPYDPLTQDPVVGPPLYGQWPAGAQHVPRDGWVAELNFDPTARAAAGLGARSVQAIQEELVASAWDQAGSARATVGALNQGRLAVETGRRITGRLRTLGDGDVLHITAPLHALLGSGPVSIRSQLASSGVPAGVVSAAHLRMTRPGTPLARGWQRLTDSPERLGRGARRDDGRGDRGAERRPRSRSPSTAGSKARRRSIRRSRAARPTCLPRRRSSGRARSPAAHARRSPTCRPSRCPRICPSPATPPTPAGSRATSSRGSIRSPPCARASSRASPRSPGGCPSTRSRPRSRSRRHSRTACPTTSRASARRSSCQARARSGATACGSWRAILASRPSSWSGPTTSWRASCSGGGTRSTSARRSSSGSGATRRRRRSTSTRSPGGGRTRSRGTCRRACTR